MKNFKTPLIIVLVFGGIGFYLWKNGDPFAAGLFHTQTEKLPPASQTPPPIKHPVNSASNDGKPLPKPDEMDKSLMEDAPEIFGKASYADVLIMEDFVRHFVVAMENATGKQIPVAMSPVKPAPDELIVTGTGPDYILSEMNFQRYRHYRDVIAAVNLPKLVGYYRRMYPDFQTIYQELGTRSYFNDKIFEVLDLVDATPELSEPIHLKHNSVRFEFADPGLESLSAIQKIILRMGPKNTLLIKKRCKEIRKLLTE